MGRLEEIGGPAFLTANLNKVLTTLNADDYANLVCEDHTRRLLLSAANEIARLSYTNELSISEMLAGAGETLRKVSERQMAHCSRELKLLVGELKIPVLAAQLSRASEVRVEKEPQLSDLRESGALENVADVVLFIWRPDAESNVSRLKVAKHRGGPVGSANLYFDARLTRFANLARAE